MKPRWGKNTQFTRPEGSQPSITPGASRGMGTSSFHKPRRGVIARALSVAPCDTPSGLCRHRMAIPRFAPGVMDGFAPFGASRILGFVCMGQPQRGFTLRRRVGGKKICNPVGVETLFFTATQSSANTRTLGYDMKPRWGCPMRTNPSIREAPNGAKPSITPGASRGIAIR